MAVLACGPDVVYPRRHRRLHERVRESGVVLSELPPGTQPFRWSFPARNRIMAGLARMTVVVEAADPSGSLITTDFARDLGRSVAAVPGRVTSRVSQGHERAAAGRRRADHRRGGRARRAVRSGDAPAAADTRRPAASRTTPASRRVLEAAERMGSVGAIAAATNLDSAETRAALGRLEAEG